MKYMVKSKILATFCAGLLTVSTGIQAAERLATGTQQKQAQKTVIETSPWFDDKDLTLTGVYYYPEHWDESQWERDFKKMHEFDTESERMSYIREYLSSPESKSEFCKRHGFCAKLLTYWLNKYQIEDKDMGRSSKPVNSDAIDSSISELQKELSLLRAENRKLHRALADESLRHEACEELINLAESTYHIKVRKNSDAK